MKNLQLFDSRIFKNVELADARFLSDDPEKESVFVVNANVITSYSLLDNQISGLIVYNETELSNTGVSTFPVGLQYLHGDQTACVATRDGRMITWNPISNELEVVGEVGEGITAMAWSPDQELVVISTGNNKIVLMTNEFDVLTEAELYSEQSGEEAQVSVGWGKKETQFHGSAGKAAAVSKIIDVEPVDTRDSGLPMISWRGDGQFFAVSAINLKTKSRLILIWSRELVLQSRSENCNGLLECISWKPSGSLIAGVQNQPQKDSQSVVFFEKNGLRHGEFPLLTRPNCSRKARSLVWNQDSTILAVLVDENPERIEQNMNVSTIELWTVNNYHWYQKQSLSFKERVGSVVWDSERFTTLYAVTVDGELRHFTWQWSVDTSLGQTPTDLASVAVIDGEKLLMTPMRNMIVPPPMSAFTLTFTSPVNAVAVDVTTSSNNIVAILTDGRLALTSYEGEQSQDKSSSYDAAAGQGFEPRCQLPSSTSLFSLLELENITCPLSVHHLTFISSNLVAFCSLDKTSTSSVLHFLDVKVEEKSIVSRNSVVLNGFAFGLKCNETGKALAIQMFSGHIVRYEIATGKLSPWQSDTGEQVKFPMTCKQMAITTVDNTEVVFGLSQSFRLFLNNTEISSACTSFGIHEKFILLTTLTHTVRCICKATKLRDFRNLSDEKSHPFDESIRRVERGSQIVIVVKNDTKVVLQMPRGNLETIHPRALVLSCLRDLLDRKEILKAFLVMRKHRINMNLLYDHNPAVFLSNVEHIVKEIQSVNYINLFLTDLREEDVTRTTYSTSYLDRQNEHQSLDIHESKIDKVCDAMLNTFKKFGEKYILSILTALVKKSRPRIEEALLLVWSLHDNADSEVTATEGLNYLSFLVDVNQLYEDALGTYNFDLVMMVAEKSQKDPKEYIPFLNGLRKLEKNYMYFTIDKHLKRHIKALEHINKCGDEHLEEYLNFITEHKLYVHALKIFKPGTERYRKVSYLYGCYLKSKNRHDEAGVVFYKGEDWQMALDSFTQSYNWRQAFSMAYRLKYSSNHFSEIALKTAGNLRNHNRLIEAAQVYEEYLHDPEEAITVLLSGHHFEEALLLIHKHNRLDVLDTLFFESLKESHEQFVSALTTQEETFVRHKNRLGVVRENKIRASLLEGSDYNDADADLFSDTSSMTGASVASLSSAKTSRSTIFTNTGSARTRRKAEHKKWSLKEGSQNEECALVEALSKIIKHVDTLRGETTMLVKMLVQFNRDESASSLQEQFSSFLSLIQDSVKEIWPEVKSSQNISGPSATSNLLALATQGENHISDTNQKDPVLLVPQTIKKDSGWKLHIAGLNQDR